MTDDPRTDDSGGGDGSKNESTGDSRIDEFLERFEGDQQSTEPTGPPSDLNGPPDGPPNDPDESPDDSLSDPDGSSDGKRLWDSFDTGRDDETAEQPPETETDAGAHSDTVGEFESDASEEFGVDDQLTQEYTADSHETTPDEPTASGTEFADAEGDAEPTGSESTESTDDSSTSFRSILERISHRIGGFGSSSTAESTESGGSTAEPNETGPASTDRTESGATAADPAGTARTTGGPTGPGPTAESTHSDTIDEILNNIDLFGRATSSSQVLLLSPTAHSITNDIYARFLMPTDGAGQNVLFVTATQSANDQLAAARKIPEWRDGKTAVIEVGRSALKPPRPGDKEDITAKLDVYKQISNLKHLAKLGINISHIVSQWNSSRRPTVVGVHTLSAVQQYVGNETMFQFLFTLKGQLNSMGVMGFYHMDPAVHTENEIDTIQSAFDLVIRIESDGSVEIL